MKLHNMATLVTLSWSSLSLAHDVQLRSLKANGSGCPVQDGSDIPYGFDGQWLTVELGRAFDTTVVKGDGISLKEARKNCALMVDLDAPGYRYAVERVVTWGSYQLGTSDRFTATTNGFFTGSGDDFFTSDELAGPSWRQQPYKFDRTLSASDLLWSDCQQDRTLTLNNAVRVATMAAHSRSTGNSSGSLERVAYRFIYQSCRE